METTFEITPSELQTNEKLIKRARWWIITAFVWEILVSMAFYILPYVMDTELWSKYHQLFGWCANIIFISFTYLGLWSLRKHTFLPFRQFSIMLFIALCGDRIFIIIKRIIFDWILPTPSEEYWLSIWPLVNNLFDLVVTLFFGYLCCAAYSFLCRNKEIEAVYRPAFYLLCIALFIDRIINVIIDSESIAPCLWDLSSINASSLYFDFKSMLYDVLNPLYFVVYIIFIIGYKRLFATPSAFPAKDDGSAYISIWKPSRMTAGFLVSMLLFIALLYFMVRIVFFQQ